MPTVRMPVGKTAQIASSDHVQGGQAELFTLAKKNTGHRFNRFLRQYRKYCQGKIPLSTGYRFNIKEAVDNFIEAVSKSL